MILDEQVPTADPEALVAQYDAFIKKIAKRYIPVLSRTGAVDLDDLYQVGRCALLNAQTKYDPAEGYSFTTFVFNWIRSAMRRALGFSSTGAPPMSLDYLDEPLTGEEDCDTSRLDMIPDPSILPFNEPLIDEESRQETAEAVRAAVDRLKNAKQREIITRCWLKEQPKPEAAAEMGIKLKSLQMIDLEARHRLQRDKRLRQYVVPFFHVTRSRFNSTWTSAVEAAVIWREEHLPQYMQDRSVNNDS